jgi:hypothetical protein
MKHFVLCLALLFLLSSGTDFDPFAKHPKRKLSKDAQMEQKWVGPDAWKNLHKMAADYVINPTDDRL